MEIRRSRDPRLKSFSLVLETLPMRDRQCASRDSNDAVGTGAVSTVVIVGGALLLGQTVRRLSKTVFCGESNSCESVETASSAIDSWRKISLASKRPASGSRAMSSAASLSISSTVQFPRSNLQTVSAVTTKSGRDEVSRHLSVAAVRKVSITSEVQTVYHGTGTVPVKRHRGSRDTYR
jgi:hypothetical protein